MSMDLIMVLRGQYTAGEDMEQRLQDLTSNLFWPSGIGVSRCRVISATLPTVFPQTSC